MKPRNDIQEAFNQGGAWRSEESKRQIMDWVKNYNPYYCVGCQEFSILGDLKEFECQLCGTAIECMSYDYEDRRIFEIEMRRKLLIAL